jgi:hypothetical protein
MAIFRRLQLRSENQVSFRIVLRRIAECIDCGDGHKRGRKSIVDNQLTRNVKNNCGLRVCLLKWKKGNELKPLIWVWSGKKKLVVVLM